jgi:hypothetical protein
MPAVDPEQPSEERTRIVGSFVDADDSILPLLHVIGKVVVASRPISLADPVLIAAARIK